MFSVASLIVSFSVMCGQGKQGAQKAEVKKAN